MCVCVCLRVFAHVCHIVCYNLQMKQLQAQDDEEKELRVVANHGHLTGEEKAKLGQALLIINHFRAGARPIQLNVSPPY